MKGAKKHKVKKAIKSKTESNESCIDFVYIDQNTSKNVLMMYILTILSLSKVRPVWEGPFNSEVLGKMLFFIKNWLIKKLIKSVDFHDNKKTWVVEFPPPPSRSYTFLRHLQNNFQEIVIS